MTERAGRTDLRRFESSTRASFYFIPVVVTFAAASSLSDGGSAVAFAAVIVHGAVSLVVSARAFAEPGPRSHRLGYLALSVVCLGALILTCEPADVYAHGAAALAAAPLVFGSTLAVLGLRIPWQRLVGVGGAGLALVVAGFAARGLGGVGLGAVGVYTAGVGAVLLPTGTFTWWMLDVVRTLARSRTTYARLAVAEERLRFSRDLHDVYGRTLSAVALKSELAAELARRGDDRAAGEMTAVRDLAQSSLADARRIVSGYREIDPATEVAGARSVLRSAGASLHVDGLDDALARLDRRGRTAAAWVLREATTNVLRHSDATSVRLCGRATGDAVTIVVENDGAPRRGGPTVEGTGLLGLAERLDAVGGSLHADQVDHHYRLTATLPVAAPRAAGGHDVTPAGDPNRSDASPSGRASAGSTKGTPR